MRSVLQSQEEYLSESHYNNIISHKLCIIITVREHLNWRETRGKDEQKQTQNQNQDEEGVVKELDWRIA